MNRRNFLKRVVAIPAALGLGAVGAKAVAEQPIATTEIAKRNTVREQDDVKLWFADGACPPGTFYIAESDSYHYNYYYSASGFGVVYCEDINGSSAQARMVAYKRAKLNGHATEKKHEKDWMAGLDRFAQT